MTDAFEQQIAAIEAANAGEPDTMEPGAGEPQPEPQAEGAPADEGEPSDPPADTQADEGADEEAGDDQHDDPAEDAEAKRRRSKPASQRIAELTAKLREAERQLEAVNKPAEKPAELVKPDPTQFEYGEADPQYIDKLTDWKLESYKREQQGEQAQREQQQAQINRIQVGLAKAEAEAQVKYDDFDAAIAKAANSRATPLPPIVSVGISTSPVGGDLLYRIATDEAVSDRLDTVANNHKAAAMVLGEIEGEYLDDLSDSDLDITDEMDMARMLGRMRARAAGKRASQPQKQPAVTNAPVPPDNRVRGSSGKFKPAPDTDDPKEFMRHYGAGIGV